MITADVGASPPASILHGALSPAIAFAGAAGVHPCDLVAAAVPSSREKC